MAEISPKLPDTKLTPEQQAKVNAWLQKHWVIPHPCEVCKQERWSTSSSMMCQPVIDPQGLYLLGGHYVFVGIICQTCGHTILLNAVTIGILGGAEKNAT